MTWVKTQDERRCENCGVVFDHWFLQKYQGDHVAEATFCPICYPDLKRVFDNPE